MSKYLKIGFIVIAALASLAWFFSMQVAPVSRSSLAVPSVRKAAPNFILRDIDGKPVSLSSYKGKAVYIKFWASWCGDCIKQVVPQRRLEESLKGSKSIVFLNVSIDKDENAWERAVERNKLTAIELISNNGEDADIGTNYAIDEIPRYILIDKNGIVVDNNAPKPSEIDSDYFSQYM